MTTALFMLTGILVIVGIITLLDWLSRRKEQRRREHHRPA
jgi:purine-cytosine permease-like protein